MKKHDGKLIVFEGTDGTGKSTQIDLLASHLDDQGHSIVVTREPTDSIYGKKIRQHYTSRGNISKEQELQLFIDDRKEHVKNLILPSMEAGKVILCDRYYLSTAAYQGAAGFDPEEIFRMNSFAPEPNMAIIFELEPEKSIERITASRGDILNDFEQLENLQLVKSIFDSMRFEYIRRIDADQPVAKVHQQIVESVNALFQSN